MKGDEGDYKIVSSQDTKMLQASQWRSQVVNISREAYAQWQHKNAESRGFSKEVSGRQLAYVDRPLSRSLQQMHNHQSCRYN